jgi:hypothetical protein
MIRLEAEDSMSETEPSETQSPLPEGAKPGNWQGYDLILPLVAAICVILGWYVVIDYERAALEVAHQAPGLVARVWRMRLIMAFGGVGGLGLAWLAARDARKRRQAERELERLNAELAHRVVRRTAELRARTKDLRESRLREKLREKEAEVAFQAGLVEAAGQYLHDVGNALSALELELLRLSRATEGTERIAAAFDSLAGDIAASRIEEAGRLLLALREAVLDRAFPRINAARDALDEIKEHMSDELERRRGEFERGGLPVRYHQLLRVDLELEAVLDRLPRAAGSDPVHRDIDAPVGVRTRKHAFLTGLAALLRQALDTAPGRVTVRLRQEPDSRAVLTVEGAGEDCAQGTAVASFINFLNENNGSFRFDAGAGGHPSLLVVAIGSAEETPHDLPAGP